MIKIPGPKNSNSKQMVNRQKVVPRPTQPKRDDIFSKSRDTREDRGARQMKTAHNPQTFSHGH
jgi:hypothetical protein